MSDRGDLHSVNTFADEAIAFTRRHPDLDPVRASFGGLAWGLRRALYECPNCPGVYRIPLPGDGERIGCVSCGGCWRWATEEESAPVPAKGKTQRRADAVRGTA